MKLRTAVVGVGYLGRFHAQKHKQLEQKYNSELIAVCDSDLSRAQLVAAELGTSACAKPEELLGRIDALTIASSTPYHFELSQWALEHGIHVNVEKPMTLDSHEAQRLVDLAHKKKLTLAVGHSERFNPAFCYLSNQLKRQKLWQLHFHRHAPWTGRSTEVSVVYDLMIHDIDLALSLDSSAVTVSFAEGGVQLSRNCDFAQARLQFESGLSALVSCSRTAASMQRLGRVLSEQASYLINFQSSELEISSLSPEVKAEKKEFGKADNLLAETEDFFTAIMQRRPATVSGEEGLRALQVAEQISRMIQL